MNHASRPMRAGFLAACLSLLAAAALMAGIVPSAEADPACGNEALRGEQHSGFLPDCRAYELVSPPDKNGGDIITVASRTRAAADGGAVAFASLTGFGDVLGTGIATEYMSERDGHPGGTGWGTHAITPLQTSFNPQATNLREFGYEPMYGAITADLTTGVFEAWSPLTSDPYVAETLNLYTRSDLRNLGTGSYTLATACPLCEGTDTPLPPFYSPTNGTGRPGTPHFAAVSADGQQVLFESTLKLTADAIDGVEQGVFNVYRSDHGSTSLVSLIPVSGSECIESACVPAVNAIAGQGARDVAKVGQAINANIYTPHVLSQDGARAFFTTDFAEGGCGTPSWRCGRVFMRDFSTTPARTIQLNASERQIPDPNGPKPAFYWEASSDGSRAFFTTSGQLTDDDTVANLDLYMFEAGAPAGERLTRLSVPDPSLGGAPPSVEAVLGTSEDGHYVYFAADGPLAPGQPLPNGGERLVFVWHDDAGTPSGGQIDYVGMLAQFLNAADGGLNSVTANRVLRESRVSLDGRYLLFSAEKGDGLLSNYGEPDADHGSCGGVGGPPCRQLYLYDAQAQQLHCISCRPGGLASTRRAVVNPQENAGASKISTYLNRAVSADGRYAFFSTADALVDTDTNGASDAYAYDSATDQAHLLSSGTDPSDSYFLDASVDGTDAFIATRERLLGWDDDQAYDLYDVRVDGGFPEPPSIPAPCEGDGCRAAIAPAAAAGTVASAAFVGPGNPTAGPRKGRHEHRKHGKRKHKKHGKGKRAHGNGRAGR